MEDILKELQELKNLAVLGAKQVLNVNGMSAFTGLSQNTVLKSTDWLKIKTLRFLIILSKTHKAVGVLRQLSLEIE